MSLIGTGIDLPLGGSEVIHEESQSGGSSEATSVSTAANLTGVIGHLYLAAITTKQFQAVTAVTGLGLTWNRLIQQCSGRNQTGIEVWTARGIPSGNSQVTAILAAAPNSAAIIVSRYSGLDALEPTGTLLSGNTNGQSGVCTSGSDSSSYTFSMTTTANGALIYAVAAMRNKAHEPGAAYTELAEFTQGNSGSTAAGLAVQQQAVLTESTVLLDGAFSSSVDWAVAGVELKPVGSSIPVSDIAVLPASHDYGSLLVNTNLSQSFAIRNDGEADLHVDGLSLGGLNASAFSLGNVDLPFVVPQGQSQNVQVNFNPTTTGIKHATLQISSDDPNENPFNVSLTGRAVDSVAPDIVVDPMSHDYGTVVINVGVSTTFEIRNDGINDLTVTGTTLLGAQTNLFAIISGGAPFILGAGETRSVEVSFTPDAEGSAAATLRIVSDDPDEGEVDVVLTGSGLSVAGPGAMWISAAELARKAMSGSAWESVKGTADGDLGTANIADLHSKHDIKTLAVALVYARTGDPFYRQKAADAILSAIGTDEGGSAHALGRNGASYIIAADLINLSEYDPAADAAFRSWLDAARFVERSDGTLIEEDESRANNHGRYAGATRVAIAVYLGDQAEIERAAQVFKGLLGDRASYNGFAWKNDLSWQADPTQPVGINPLGAVKDGYTIDGALPEEMRRGCAFQSPPCYTGYPWEGLQGILVEAVLLSRQGYDVFNWQDRAILRSIQFLDHLRVTYPQAPWWAIGDDTFIPWLVNAIYGTTFVTTSPIQLGDIMGWTDWTHSP